MKIYSLLFLFCLVQIIFSKSEDYYIEPIGELQAIDCFPNEENSIYYYGFTFLALTSGFPKDESFYIFLDDPKHSFAQCNVNAVTAELEQQIYCYVIANHFPLFDIKSIVVPNVIKLGEENKHIQIENWKGGEVPIPSACYMPYTYEYTQNQNEIFTVTDNSDETQEDTKVLTAYGSFQSFSFSNNKLTSSEYTIRPPVIVDDDFTNIDCTISPANGGEDLIECTVKGQKRVVFFPTMAMESSTLGEYIKFNVDQEVSLYGSFIKLSSILLLSLFLF